MTGSSAPQPPLERLLDLGLYAPLGFLLTRDTAVPELAAAGRKQVAFTRSLGRAAIKGLVKSAAPQPARSSLAPPQTTPAPADAATAVAADIVGYDALTAKEAIATIAGCNDAQALWIRSAETSGKQRVTVLRALDARSRS